MIVRTVDSGGKVGNLCIIQAPWLGGSKYEGAASPEVD
jgi:hypothetical protein